VKITKVEPIVLQVSLEAPVVTSFGEMKSRTCVLVRIETDTGAYGIGEVWNNFPSWGVYEKVATLKYGMAPLMLGEDPLQIQKINDKLLASCEILGLQWGAIGAIYQSISGIDIALWDLLGRHTNTPISKLFGGTSVNSVKVYASGLGPTGFETLVEKHRALGVTAYKLKVGRSDDQDFANLKDMRSRLQGDAALMIDANQAWNRTQAVRNLQRFHEFDLTWIEEPLRCDDFEGLRVLREQTEVPIALGENLYGHGQTALALETQSVRVFQPDLSKNGGMSICKTVVEMAQQYGVAFAPHFLGGAVCLAASIHFIASIPGGLMLELDTNPNPLREKLFTKPFEVKDGRLDVPEGPGLGYDLDPEFVRFHEIRLRDI